MKAIKSILVKRYLNFRKSSLFSFFKYIQTYLFVKEAIYHFGVYGKKANVGDSILYYKMEEIIDQMSEFKNHWLHRNLHSKKWYHLSLNTGEVTRWEVALINKTCKMIIVGGHGLFMIDTNKNDNSGWQFNITCKNLLKINVPIVILAVGYNTFRNQPDFQPIFKKHMDIIIQKSIFFGLRNYGSIEAIKKYVDQKYHHKIQFQPCFTTTVSKFQNKNWEIINRKKIAICLAFDRIESRYGGGLKKAMNSIKEYISLLSRRGYVVDLFVHHPNDLEQGYKFFSKSEYSIYPLFECEGESVYEYYCQYSLIIGLRGHSLMIPFGMGIPIISLTTQNKQKWFIETLNHPEWSIEVESEFLDTLYNTTIAIFNDYSNVVKELEVIQEKFVDITIQNYKKIVQNLS